MYKLFILVRCSLCYFSITKEIETQTVIRERAEKFCTTHCPELEGIMPQRLCSVCNCLYHLKCARKSKLSTTFMCFVSTYTDSRSLLFM